MGDWVDSASEGAELMCPFCGQTFSGMDAIVVRGALNNHIRLKHPKEVTL